LHGLVYLAETVGDGVPRVVARSSIFRPDLDLGSSLTAQAEIEAILARDGWQRAPEQPDVVVGVRFQRPRTPVQDEPRITTGVA